MHAVHVTCHHCTPHYPALVSEHSDNDPDSERRPHRGHSGRNSRTEDECENCGAAVIDYEGCGACGAEILCDECLTDHDCEEGFGWDE